MNSSSRLTVGIAALSLVLSACGGNEDNIVTNCDNRISVLYDAPLDAYCSTTQSYSNAVTISGTAKYKTRLIDYSTSSPIAGLLGASSSKPIRYAEVVVKDSGGSIVQCGETDGSGNYSLDLPLGSENLTLYINSRANNSNYKAYVLNCPEENGYYSLTESFTPDSTKSLGTIVADVSGEILGAAFNMLDQVLEANEYLRSEVSSCSFSGCTNFSVAPLSKIYWEKGFDPSAYGASAGSFFVRETNNRLFIIGGRNGNTDNVDTDHFDNSIILHEYAHFIEHHYMISDSPGGAHGISGPIDPRLAWSEGFANFFQAAVQGVESYVDTSGNISGSTYDLVRLSLEKHTGNYSDDHVADVPLNAEEGNFREISVSRLLYDSIDTNNDSESIQNGFEELWAVLTSATGFKKSALAFRSIGAFHELQDALSGGTDWSTLRTTEKHNADRSQYGYYIEPSGSCTGSNEATGLFSITPTKTSNDDRYEDSEHTYCGYSSFPNSECFYLDPDDPSYGIKSHLLINNDFYHVNHSGGTLDIDLEYNTPSGAEANLQLFVYSGNASYGDTDYIENNTSAGEGIQTPDYNNATTETESFSKSLPAGDYLVNIKVRFHTISIGGATTYRLKIGGTYACPASL